MKNLVTVAITAVIVSLDSFVAGFSLSINKKSTTLLPAAVALITLLLCLITSCIGLLLKQYVEQYVNYIGAALLLLLAACSLFKKDEERQQSLKEVTLFESVTIGFAVGMDAAVANLSLSLSGVGLVAPVVFAVMHYFTVYCGQILARKITVNHTNVITAVILAVLAVTKLL